MWWASKSARHKVLSILIVKKGGKRHTYRYGASGRKSRTTPALPQAQRHRRDRKVPSLAKSSLSIAQRPSILLKTDRQDENMQKRPKMNGQRWYTTAMLAWYLRTAPMHTFSSPRQWIWEGMGHIETNTVKSHPTTSQLCLVCLTDRGFMLK